MIIGICFGVRVLVMIRLMFVHYTLSSVWVAEWPLDWPFVLITLYFVYLYFLIIIVLVLRARCGF